MAYSCTLPVKWVFPALLAAAMSVGGGVANSVQAQTSRSDTTAILQADTATADTLLTDTMSSQVQPSKASRTDTLPYKISTEALEEKVVYDAADSIRFDIKNKLVYLFGDAEINYKAINLTAAFIEIDWTTNIITALPKEDSLGNLTGKPIFTEGDSRYKARKIMYNYKTKKGKIFELFTEQGDGYMHGEAVKKDANDQMYLRHGKYTTCNLDHPHFYIRLSKVKAIPDKVIVSGPANMVIADVPTPLILPFGIFPISKDRQSGILMPEYGQDQELGFFLRNGGYYFGISDYVDLSVRGDIYSRGSWRLGLSSNYKKRYRFDGRMSVNYSRMRRGMADDPNASPSKDFLLKWKHSQDPKAHPTRTFSADVNFLTPNFFEQNSFQGQQVMQNQFESSVSYRKSWKGTPFNLQASLRHQQNIRSGKMNLSLPDATFTMNRINPFKRKEAAGETRWYEQIGLSYTANIKNEIEVPDSIFFPNVEQYFMDRTGLGEGPIAADSLDIPPLRNFMRNGVQHRIPVSTSFKMLKHFTVSPNAEYQERWYWETIRKEWDDPRDTLLVHKHRGFKAGREFRGGVGINTILYGMYNFRSEKVKAMRHVVRPSVNFNYRPDFAEPKWGYYEAVQADTTGRMQRYSVFEGAVFGGPGAGEQRTIGFNLNQNLEMKVATGDTAKPEKKIKLIESLDSRVSYNMAADSMNLSDIRFNGYTRLFEEKVTVNYDALIDPYAVSHTGNRYNAFAWNEGQGLGRLTNASLNIVGNFKSQRESDRAKTEAGTAAERKMVTENPDFYVDFKVPWQLNINYNLNYSQQFSQEEDKFVSEVTQGINFDAEVNLTPNWRINVQSGYDFTNDEVTFTTVDFYRNIHCWEMRFRWVPTRKSYLFTLNVKSEMLQDMKLQKRQGANDF